MLVACACGRCSGLRPAYAGVIAVSGRAARAPGSTCSMASMLLRCAADGRAAMLKVHHLNNSRSQRILWLLEELGSPYEIVKYQRMEGIPLAPPELKEVHPLGKSPVITDGGKTIAESGAIVEYIIDKYGKGRMKPKAGTD